jgi:HEAT repeat protein
VASDSEPEQTSSQLKRAGSFALPHDFLMLPSKERREIVSSLGRTRSRRRASSAQAIQHWHEDGESEVIPALTVALELDPDAVVKRSAAFGLGCIPDQVVVPALRGALTSPDRATKAHAIYALGRLGAREAVPDLVLLLDDWYARIPAADALVAIEDADALGPLRQAAARGPCLRRRRLQKRVSALERAVGV